MSDKHDYEDAFAQGLAEVLLRDHEIAALVNELRDIARQFHDHQSLRERIAHAVVGKLKREERDNCQFCLGAKGGVRGNENCYGDVVVCDYCSVLLDRAKSKAGMIQCASCGEWTQVIEEGLDHICAECAKA